MFSKKIVDPRLANIEHAGRFDAGLASLLQKSLHNYDDSLLQGELNGAGDEIAQSGGLTEVMFIDIARSASTGYITNADASSMYKLAVRRHTSLLSSSSSDTDSSEGCPTLFTIVLQSLFKKLLILHLTRDICSHRLLIAGSAKSLDFYRSRPMEEPRVRNSKGRIKQGSKMQHKHQTLRSSVAPVNFLYKQLAESSMSQQKLDKQIASNLTLLSQTVTLGDRTSAVAFSKQVGTRKVEVLLRKKLHSYYSLSFGIWKNTYKSVNAEIFSVKFLKLLGATRIWEYATAQMTMKKLRYLKKWFTIALSMQRQDVEESVGNIQRLVRGGVGRKRVRYIRQTRAATTIQKRHRGYLGRMRMQDRVRHLQLCNAVAVVERAYQKHIWIRAGNRMRIMLYRDRASRKIQRAQKARRANQVILRIRRSRLERRSCTKIQSQWRRYLCSVYVDDIRRRRMWLDSTILLQRVTRGMLGRLYVRDEREIAAAILAVQCGWRCSVAREVVHKRRIHYRATKIQSAIRARWGRRRFRILYNAQHDAMEHIARGIRGFRCRRKYKPLIAAFTANRSAASSVLARRLSALCVGHASRQRVKGMLASLVTMQMLVRRFLFYRRANIRERTRRSNAAKLIQRAARGYNDRRLVVVLRAKKEISDKLKGRNKIPLYYRVYEQYLRDQFLLHRPMVLKMQCFFRVIRAYRRTKFFRQTRAVKKLQYVYRRHLQTKDAREVLRQRRLERIYRNECATFVNKLIRGFLGRRYVKKIHHVQTILWFINQMRSKGLASRVFDSFRMRKRQMEKAVRAATVLQGLVRGRAGRNYVRYNQKKLVKERRLRILRLRNKAARNMQALYHIMLAKNIAHFKRKERDEREEHQRVLEDLENRIDGIHGEHMIGLMTTRLQTGTRAKLARKTKKERAAERKREAELKDEQMRYNGAMKMQALIRGLQSREKFEKSVVQLRKERQSRNFCVECESQVATKRCRQCKDRFCDSCYDILHRTGLRKRHIYELVGPAALVTDKMAGIPASNPLLWEENYDEVAQGRYWYNKQTGEASWICPY